MNGGRLRLGVAALAAIGLLGGTPLIAAPHSPWQMAQVPPSPEDISGYRGLHAAVAAGDLEAVRQVQAGSAALSARDREGRTPLHVAAHLGNHALVALLLAKGADG
ncbi:MAG: ankyrin repeat domain-containing protein, partial [Alphaproteobacteria bacterium]|nr:ankyrin repeat domain-containing protein [Alphaproteobacteria bacterium]